MGRIEVNVPVARMRDAVRGAIEVREGSPYTIDAVQESLQNIYALGNVSDVRVEAVDDGNGALDLRFVVLPAPRLDETRFDGDSPVSRGILQDALRTRPGDRLTLELAEQQAERVQRALSDRGYLQSRVEPEIVVGPDGMSADLLFHVVAGAPTRLRELRITGVEGAVRDDVAAALGLRVGSTFQQITLEEGIDEALARLARRGLFHADLRIESQALNFAENTYDLTVAVDPGPAVELTISGWDRDEEERRELLAIWQEGSVADWVLKTSRRQIIEDLQEDGYWRPLVVFRRQRDEQGRNVEVGFTVATGRKARIRRIEFEGNESIPAADLAAAITTDEKGLLQGGILLNQRWERDQRLVAGLYRRRGFLSAQVVEAPVSQDAAAGGLVATMRIEEGPQTLVERVDLDFEPALPAETIDVFAWRAQLSLRQDEPYDRTAQRDDEARLRILLSNAGYPRGAVVSSAAIDQESGRARVTHVVFPGQRVRVGRILVSGNESTRDDVILREMALVPGSPYTYEGIVRSQSRLYRLGLFSRVEVRPARSDSIEAERSVVVRVEEGPTNRVSWGLGYDSEEGPRGLTTVGRDNLWGMNRQGTVSLRASFREQRARLVYTEPYLLGRRLSTSAISFYESIREEGFDVERFGATLQLTSRHSDSLTSSGRYAFRRVRTFNLEVDPAELDLEDRSAIIGSFIYSLIRDTRPDPIDPREGTYQTFDVELASELVGSESDYLKLFGRSQWYRELGSSVLATSVRIGVALPFAGDDDLPLPERFFTGGSSSLRAFGLNAAGPTDERGNPLGGKVLLLGNVELRFPVRGNLGGVLFLDAGNSFAGLDDVSVDNVRTVAGVGVRYGTPVGPVRLDWGRLLDRRSGEDGSRFFLSIGHTF